jgi:hypothetical protein
VQLPAEPQVQEPAAVSGGVYPEQLPPPPVEPAAAAAATVGEPVPLAAAAVAATAVAVLAAAVAEVLAPAAAATEVLPALPPVVPVLEAVVVRWLPVELLPPVISPVVPGVPPLSVGPHPAAKATSHKPWEILMEHLADESHFRLSCCEASLAGKAYA